MSSDALTNVLTAIYEAHRARVYRWAYGLCRSHADAADVVQDVFARIVQHPPQAGSAAELVGWLRRTTESVIIDRWRAANRRPRLVSTADSREPEASADAGPDAELNALVRGVLLSLSPQQRLVVMCKFYDDLTFCEIADELSIAISTAKTHYIRALEVLRDALQPTATAEGWR